jgi:hypothetical protein
MSKNPAHQSELETLLAISSGLNADGGNDRFKNIMHQLLSDLCQTIKKFDITDEEFWVAVNYLNELGERKEAALLAAGLGLSTTWICAPMKKRPQPVLTWVPTYNRRAAVCGQCTSE